MASTCWVHWRRSVAGAPGLVVAWDAAAREGVVVAVPSNPWQPCLRVIVRHLPQHRCPERVLKRCVGKGKHFAHVPLDVEEQAASTPSVFKRCVACSIWEAGGAVRTFGQEMQFPRAFAMNAVINPSALSARQHKGKAAERYCLERTLAPHPSSVLSLSLERLLRVFDCIFHLPSRTATRSPVLSSLEW